MRKQYKAFGRGTMEFLHPDNRRVLAFYRRYGEETVLVVANLSRFVQAASLDLSAVKGLTPVEMFGKTELPPVGDALYLMTLGAYEIYWFAIEDRRVAVESVAGTEIGGELQTVEIEDWEHVFEGSALEQLEEWLPAFLISRRWFRGAGRRIASVVLIDSINVPNTRSWLLLTEVIYENDERETYTLLASLAVGTEAISIREQHPEATAIRLRTRAGEEGALYSALWDKSFALGLFDAIARRRRIRGERGEVGGDPHPGVFAGSGDRTA